MINVSCEYRGLDYPKLDGILADKIVGKHSTSSGMGFGRRDLDWEFKDKDHSSAIRSFKKLLKVKKKYKLFSVTLYSE